MPLLKLQKVLIEEYLLEVKMKLINQLEIYLLMEYKVQYNFLYRKVIFKTKKICRTNLNFHRKKCYQYLKMLILS